MAAKLARSQRTARGGDPSEGRSLLKVGDLLAGKYRVERILGEGGMGVVVAAYHELLDQHVAVKLLYQDVADREAQSRLLLEARSAAKLKSEHVARVIDVDTGADGLPFIVMELLDGADLCQICDATGPQPHWVVVDYILQALEGLAHAHAHGIIHRDLKPSNLFLANRVDGTQVLKILDFGISKSQEQSQDRRTAQLTGGRAVLGSPPYMSPEQVRSPKSVDHRTDIWSIGICMYELLTNSMPFGGEEIQETFAQILENQPTPLASLVPGIPDGLEHVVMRCLAKRRDERWKDVGELARALVPYGSGAWAQSADRIAATLARPLLDDATSGTRLKNLPAPPSVPRPIPSSPSRGVDSMNPELTGTASTVAARFTMLDVRKKWWLIAAATVPALIGISLIGLTLVAKARASALAPAPPVETAADADEGSPPALPAAVGAAPAPAAHAPPVPASGSGVELASAATSSSPAGAHVAGGSGGSGASGGKASGRAVSAPPTPAKPTASAPSPAKKPAASGAARPALPPGLPLTRQ